MGDGTPDAMTYSSEHPWTGVHYGLPVLRLQPPIPTSIPPIPTRDAVNRVRNLLDWVRAERQKLVRIAEGCGRLETAVRQQGDRRERHYVERVGIDRRRGHWAEPRRRRCCARPASWWIPSGRNRCERTLARRRVTLLRSGDTHSSS